jgi:hypothetical protein
MEADKWRPAFLKNLTWQDVTLHYAAPLEERFREHYCGGGGPVYLFCTIMGTISVMMYPIAMYDIIGFFSGEVSELERDVLLSCVAVFIVSGMCTCFGACVTYGTIKPRPAVMECMSILYPMMFMFMMPFLFMWPHGQIRALFGRPDLLLGVQGHKAMTPATLASYVLGHDNVVTASYLCLNIRAFPSVIIGICSLIVTLLSLVASSPNGEVDTFGTMTVYGLLPILAWVGRWFTERGKRREWSHVRRVSQMIELLTQVQTMAKVRGGVLRELQMNPEFSSLFGTSAGQTLVTLADGPSEAQRAKEFSNRLLQTDVPQKIHLVLKTNVGESLECMVVGIHAPGEVYFGIQILDHPAATKTAARGPPVLAQVQDNRSLVVEFDIPPTFPTSAPSSSEMSATEVEGLDNCSLGESEARTNVTKFTTASAQFSVVDRQVDAMSAESFTSVDNGSVGMRMDNQRVRLVLRAEDVADLVERDIGAQRLDWQSYEIPMQNLTFLDGNTPFHGGSEGEIYRALWETTIVAVKLKKSLGGASASKVKLFAREIGVLFRMRHPHILLLCGYVTAPNAWGTCLVTEYCFGGSVFDRLRELTPNVALNVAIQVVSAVTYLHSVNVMHRDLKTDNVFLMQQDLAYAHAKLGDFGSSRVVGVAGAQTPDVGTPGFMAPEVTSTDGHYGISADIFAMGMLVYEMVVRRFPFSPDELKGFYRRYYKLPASHNVTKVSEQESHDILLWATAYMSYKPDMSYLDSVPGLGKLVETCTSTDAELRPAARDLWDSLRMVQADYRRVQREVADQSSARDGPSFAV